MKNKLIKKRILSLAIASVIAFSSASLLVNNNVYAASKLETIGNATATLAENQNVIIDGTSYELDAYNIDGYNYFKARDITTPLKFYTTWDNNLSAVSIDTDKPFEEGNAENPELSDTVEVVMQRDYLFVDGHPTVSTFCNIDGYTYFKLRDIADATANSCNSEYAKPTQKYITVDFDESQNAISVNSFRKDTK